MSDSQCDREQVAQAVVGLLNEALELDPVATQVLTEVRVRCNEDLARHPTIQVSAEASGGATVGLMGLLNGFLAQPERDRYLLATFDEEHRLTGFQYTQVKAATPVQDLLSRLERMGNFLIPADTPVGVYPLYGVPVKLFGGVGGRYLFRESGNGERDFSVRGPDLPERFDIANLEDIVRDAEQYGWACEAKIVTRAYRGSLEEPQEVPHD